MTFRRIFYPVNAPPAQAHCGMQENGAKLKASGINPDGVPWGMLARANETVKTGLGVEIKVSNVVDVPYAGPFLMFASSDTIYPLWYWKLTPDLAVEHGVVGKGTQEIRSTTPFNGYYGKLPEQQAWEFTFARLEPGLIAVTVGLEAAWAGSWRIPAAKLWYCPYVEGCEAEFKVTE